MKLGFYYHIPVQLKDNKVYLPSLLGLFLISLSNHVEQLMLFMHVEANNNLPLEDYCVERDNIKFVNLGIKTPAWHRIIFNGKFLNLIKRESIECDAILVRAPSPLAPYFSKKFKEKPKIFYYLVGDYAEGIKNFENGSFRDKIIAFLLRYNDNDLYSEIKDKFIFVNSISLANRYEIVAKKVEVVKTTTLSLDSFYERLDTCIDKNVINLLYTGRYEAAKGLFELINAVAKLSKINDIEFILNIAGWDVDVEKKFEKKLIAYANEKGIKLVNHGKKNLGIDLYSLYRDADIYIMPSYHEGFPRTIWEAMANCCPVIATKVGGIPYFLQNEENAILIEPKSDDEIVEAIEFLINNTRIRQNIIKNGYAIAKTNTFESQSKILIDKIKSEL